MVPSGILSDIPTPSAQKASDTQGTWSFLKSHVRTIPKRRDSTTQFTRGSSQHVQDSLRRRRDGKGHWVVLVSSGFAFHDIPPPCFSHRSHCIKERCRHRTQNQPANLITTGVEGRPGRPTSVSSPGLHIKSQPAKAHSETLPKNKQKLEGCFTSKNDDQVTFLFKNSSLHIPRYSNGP